MTDSSSDCTCEDEYVFYRNRPHWKDVTPVPQDDGPVPVVAIAYTEQFREIYDYFRAILRSGEKSERVLELTNDAAQLNPANYTVWQYRREVLSYLNSNLGDELVYIGEIITDHQKNYQVWHHRRVIVEWMKDPSKEIPFTNIILAQDSKNYHAWQHRQWVVATYNLYDSELEFVNDLLLKDVRNNSAWNHRYFVIIHTSGFTADTIKHELEYTAGKIREVVNNESAWNYLRGVLCHTESGNISSEEFVLKFCEDLYETGCRSPYLLALIVDICEELFELGTSNTVFSVQRALQICDDLALEHDKIRKEYWKFISRKINQALLNRSTD
ncbi:Protein farnesyltransferase/geranylgeranyltransferase type-1 subunit alpha [Frankliniella fusca]|uniref:Protein farnesyltransferase/geranylgeranyltransferase type-1 subunit alpha n=1 Tax=Frankliniella fusca TaxID=407009 RepID=A0AAE1I040_9NEOP|nr:Protein farnesyltransferase/geranylgeranyltransferase type-1 subunit alpha [Frankliniella fusca]